MATADKARSITLDELITTATRSSIKTFRELEPKLKLPPKIWVGIWIDPTEIFKDLGTNVPNR
jgi:hypothetical protein